ncbi:D-alanyl-D-alanine carboxypeptidase/D-alanyl-D-alanine endopeptidase [Halolamina rubra]|uniref:D-alanyl-D-alanine carboxypeptidase/D-alanyl-D-alanine endopeptidase n=1 Tax=Halolamina rubra TaxID=1380430 RepID=UPI0009E35826|nr:D-alanyl-D-alanine carboxypeptidase/D-alanyl-D-alanine-endopeptidase [Halolamina rubra]
MTDVPSAVSDLQLPGASLSVLAVERSSGDRLVQNTPDRALAPASNTKLVTAGLALEYLGPDWQFETQVLGPEPENGDVDGDIVLVGDGAPDLDQSVLSNLAADVTRQISRVTGDIVIDGTMFPDGEVGPGWTWGDTRYYYGARSSAVALNRNQVTVTVTSNAGDPSISVQPETPTIEIAATVTVDGTAVEDDLQIFTDSDTGTITVKGAVPPEATPIEESVPVPSPERHTGLAFQEALDEAGVEIEGKVRVRDRADDRQAASDPSVFARVDSSPLRELVREMNVPSDNFIAEQIARRVAHEATGDGTWSGWESLVEKHFDSLGTETVRIRDGSGLSRYNLVPAKAIVAHLRWVDDQPWRSAFFDSLPTPGTGTLDSRLEGVPVAAKTGTITGTSALSGVVRRETEPDVIFSVLHGGLTQGGSDKARTVQNAFVRWLADYAD